MGRPVHFEIHASNPEQLAGFYRELFGWTIETWPGPVPYWSIVTGAEGTPGINGGIVQRRGDVPALGQSVNAFVCTIDVADVDASMAKALTLGATEALPKMPIPGIGWLGYIMDPDQNILGLMQSDPAAA